MADPVIVPPPPTITQPAAPVDDSPGLEQLQKAFDRVLPEKFAPKKETPPVTTEKPPVPPVTTEKPPPVTTEKPPEKPAEEFKIPSFLRDETIKPPVTPPEVDAEIPDDLPHEQRKSRIKDLRDAYNRLKQEMVTLKERPPADPNQTQRVTVLEAQNRQMMEALSRYGVENSADFQRNVMLPLHQSWNEAARIVKDAGGDPQELAKAMSLNGKSQFEALDHLFSEIPESAKLEAHDALRAYRRFDEMRRNAIANAPKTLEGIRQRETERQHQELNRQHNDMVGMFNRALTRLRDEAKVEVFRKTDDPEAKWWNDQSDQIEQTARSLFLENTDMDKVAMACLLAPAAETYRKLFIRSQQNLVKLEKLFKEKIGNEPVLSESGGPGSTPSTALEEDLKKPFSEVFLREFHRSQQRGGR